MDIITNLDKFPRTEAGCVLTIGNFDGLHMGHQEIISSAGNFAQRKNLPLYLMTFDPPPLFVLRGENRPPQITAPIMKMKLIEETGKVDGVILVKPDRNFLGMIPREFVWNILIEKLNIKFIVEGQTFNFGARGSGTIVTLQELGEEFGFETFMTPSCKMRCSEGETAISSTLVRSKIATCNFSQVKCCLGRNYILPGTVVKGRGVGRTMGYPTANIQPYTDYQQMPEDGVFACRARIGNNFEHAWNSQKSYKAAVSMGYCQTFKDVQHQTEAFLLDYEGDFDSLVDKHILLEYVAKLRDQVTFTDPGELASQIGKDCQEIDKLLS